jgi:TRAP transporter TAXI family solute receptor
MKILMMMTLFMMSLFGWFRYDVGMMTGGVKGTYIKFGVDCMDMMKRRNILVRPIVSYGSELNLIALKRSRGVDLAIVQADVLKVYRDKARNNRHFLNMLRNFRYIAKLYDEEIHVLTYDNSNINYFRDLNNKIVAIGSQGSGTALTSKQIFSMTGILPRKLSYKKNEEALEALKERKIDAAIFVGGKPLPLLKGHLQGLKFVKFSDNTIRLLSGVYGSTYINGNDYPSIGMDNQIPTISVASILACYNWPRSNRRRYNSITEFMKTLYKDKDILAWIGEKRGNLKWRDIDFYETVPGWLRHSYMNCILNNPVESCR